MMPVTIILQKQKNINIWRWIENQMRTSQEER